MICLHCGSTLKGMADSRIVRVGNEKGLLCADLEACARRVEDNQREARGLPPLRREHAKVHEKVHEMKKP